MHHRVFIVHRITRSKAKPGFSLVELVAVVMVIGILATAALVSWGRAIEHQKGQGAETGLRMIFEAEREYALHEGGGHYTSDLGTPGPLIPKYLTASPHDADWTYAVSVGIGGATFTATATRQGQAGGCKDFTATIDQTGTLDPHDANGRLDWPPAGCR